MSLNFSSISRFAPVACTALALTYCKPAPKSEFAATERVEVAQTLAETGIQIDETLKSLHYNEIMASIREELYSYQVTNLERENLFGGKVDPHVALALGDIEIGDAKLLDALAIEQLVVYYKKPTLLQDMSKHPGDAINILIRATNMDLDRKFQVRLDDDKRHERGGKPTVTRTLREIIKGYLQNLPKPSIHGIHTTGETRPDEWTLLLFAYASQDEELRGFMKNIRYKEVGFGQPYKPTSIKEYIKGAEIELNGPGTSEADKPTCFGMHALEALLVYNTFTGNDLNSRLYLNRAVQTLDEINEQSGRLLTEDFFKLAHILDALGQIASRTTFKESETKTIRQAYNRGVAHLQEPDSSSDELAHTHALGAKAHFYVGATNLKEILSP